MIPENIIFVVGTHDTGKTTFIERLLPALIEHGCKVSTIKDIHVDGFSIDAEGKDTRRHMDAGAQITVARGRYPGETSFIIKNALALETMIHYLQPHSDIIIVEGFKEQPGMKVLAAGTKDELSDILGTITSTDVVLGVTGKVTTDATYKEVAGDWLDLSEQDGIVQLVERLLPIIKRGRLAGNRLAMPLEDATCTLTIDGEDIKMKPFVSGTLRNILVGIVAALTWNVNDPVYSLQTTMSRTFNEKEKDWDVDMTVGKKTLAMNQFVKDTVLGTLLGYIATLQLPGSGIDGCSRVSISIG